VASNVFIYLAGLLTHAKPESMGLSNLYFYLAWEQGFFPFLWSLKAFVFHGFFHSGFGHLAGNMIFLAALGPILERKLGSRHYFYLYFAGMIVAGIVGLILNPFSEEALIAGMDFPSLIGASGAISAVIAGVLAASPRSIVGLIPAIKDIYSTPAIEAWFANKPYIAPLYYKDHYVEAWFVASFFILEQLLVVKSMPTGSAAIHIAGLVAGAAFIIGLKVYNHLIGSKSTSNSSS
jgi:membrane associated rhomboid family serine protease